MIEALAVLSVRFPEATRGLTESQQKVYFETYVEDLGEIPLHIFERAIKSCRKNCTWFPKVTEIIESAKVQHHEWMYSTDTGRPEKPVEDTETNPAMQAQIAGLVAGRNKS